MKLNDLLLEGRQDMLLLQQQLVDALDDDYEVQLKATGLSVSHKLMKRPVLVKVEFDGTPIVGRSWCPFKENAKVKIGSMRCDLYHPRLIEETVKQLGYKLDPVRMASWLTEHGFNVVDRDNIERRFKVVPMGAGFLSKDVLYVKHDTAKGYMLLAKLGFDSYGNPQHECWKIEYKHDRKHEMLMNRHGTQGLYVPCMSERTLTFDKMVDFLKGEL